jgi:hypothetical protein
VLVGWKTLDTQNISLNVDQSEKDLDDLEEEEEENGPEHEYNTIGSHLFVGTNL